MLVWYCFSDLKGSWMINVGHITFKDMFYIDMRWKKSEGIESISVYTMVIKYSYTGYFIYWIFQTDIVWQSSKSDL